MSEAITNLNKTNFWETVRSSSVPILVDFWAPWCGPCRALAPILDQLATEVGENAKIAKINVDEEPELAQEFGVQSIPSLYVFRNGEAVGRMVGVQDKRTLVAALS